MKTTDSRLIDTHDRQINYMRVSITDRCNLRCSYCYPRQPVEKMPHESILRYEEILRVITIATRLGITKVRVTGGEPLVRKGCLPFLERMTRIASLTDISLTTNGLLLDRHLGRLADIGIKRINISLDTLAPEKYHAITGFDAFDTVWKAILRAADMGFSPIKINVVAMRGINDDELADLAALTRTFPFHIRFIELMPFGSPRDSDAPPLLVPEIRSRIGHLGSLKPVSRHAGDGPAKRYRFDGAPGEIGFISPVSHHFCRECNRLRLTADGRIRMCLLSDAALDIKGPLREGASDATVAEVLREAVRIKPFIRKLDEIGANCPASMASIGG